MRYRFPFARSFQFAGLLTLLSVAASFAEDDGVRSSLFNGENLNGWIVTGCQVGIEDGNLVLQDGNGFVRTEHRYGDFILELKWRSRRGADYDSGIYFRCDAPPDGKPWPPRYQANLKQGLEGNVGGLPKAVSKGLAKPDEWNEMKLTVVGNTAKLEFNGQPAWETDGIEQAEGYVGLQAEVPLGGQFEFKDIYITELKHRSLFNGQDLSGWEPADPKGADAWKVDDGQLVCTGQKGTWLRSKEEYGDFNLRLEYKLKPGGNSGVYLRVAEDGAHRDEGTGVEIQILDDEAERYRDLKPWQFTGSVYAIAAAEEHVGREPGKWNSLEIDCRGTSYRITHNGVVIVDAEESEFPDLAKRREHGFLGLQNHSEEVWYRNLRIGPSMQQPTAKEASDAPADRTTPPSEEKQAGQP